MHWDLSGNRIHEWMSDHRVEGLALAPNGRVLVAMDDVTHIHVYDFTTREFLYKIDLKIRLTSLTITQDSTHVLVGLADGQVLLIDLHLKATVQQYAGQKGGDYIIRNSLGGADENYVIGGSDGKPASIRYDDKEEYRHGELTMLVDGHVLIWHKATATLVEKLLAHSPRCNSVSWCPSNPRLFASCGDDGTIKM